MNKHIIYLYELFRSELIRMARNYTRRKQTTAENALFFNTINRMTCILIVPCLKHSQRTLEWTSFVLSFIYILLFCFFVWSVVYGNIVCCVNHILADTLYITTIIMMVSFELLIRILRDAEQGPCNFLVQIFHQSISLVIESG